MSAVVWRRNNWLLSPGKFPDQFLSMIDKNKKLFSSSGGGVKKKRRVKKKKIAHGLKKERSEEMKAASERRIKGSWREQHADYCVQSGDHVIDRF